MGKHTVEDGIQFLVRSNRDITLGEAIERIEIVTKNPRIVRQILDESERRSLIKREGKLIISLLSSLECEEEKIITRKGEFICCRCGSSLVKGYFIEFNSKEWGPFGPTCVRKYL
jgi:hypothetical protein